MHSLFEPVFNLKIWNPLEVLDDRSCGEPFYQSRCANEDILHIDRESFGAQMCQISRASNDSSRPTGRISSHWRISRSMRPQRSP